MEDQNKNETNSHTNRPTLIQRVAEMLGLKPNQANLVKILAVAMAIGILLLNAGGLFGVADDKPPKNSTPVSASEPQDSDLSRMEQAIASGLEETLSLIEGAGQVRVWVTLESGPTSIPVTDIREDHTTTHEKAGEGSTRETVTTQKQVTNVTTKGGHSDVLAVLKQSRAEVAGVLIVADGARSSAVRARIHQAAVTALRLPAHRISVVPAQGR